MSHTQDKSQCAEEIVKKSLRERGDGMMDHVDHVDHVEQAKNWLLVGLLVFFVPITTGIITWNVVQMLERMDQMQAGQAVRGERITKLEVERLADKEALARIERKLDELTQLVEARGRPSK